jgi:hypothetical protein
MVRIINYKERLSEEGKPFFVLELQGGIEMVKSKDSGRFYATAKKAQISSTFDEQTCMALIGTEMPGSIIKQECEPYDYVVKETGEELTLYHRWVYTSDESNSQKRVKDESNMLLQGNVKEFSQNGVLEHAM